MVVDGASSRPVTETSGVPQGTVLGPFMFLFFINAIQDCLECTLRLCADDALLCHTINDHHDALALQRELNHSKCYKMAVHKKKTSINVNYILYN